MTGFSKSWINSTTSTTVQNLHAGNLEKKQELRAGTYNEESLSPPVIGTGLR